MRKLLSILIAVSSPALAADEAPGRTAFHVCSSCHSDTPDAIGPSLRGVVGRPAASQPGFRYSGPLKRSGIIWTPDRLRAFIVDPQNVVPGNRMPFGGTSQEMAADIVSYLLASSPPEKSSR